MVLCTLDIRRSEGRQSLALCVGEEDPPADLENLADIIAHTNECVPIRELPHCVILDLPDTPAGAPAADQLAVGEDRRHQGVQLLGGERVLTMGNALIPLFVHLQDEILGLHTLLVPFHHLEGVHLLEVVVFVLPILLEAAHIVARMRQGRGEADTLLEGHLHIDVL